MSLSEMAGLITLYPDCWNSATIETPACALNMIGIRHTASTTVDVISGATIARVEFYRSSLSPKSPDCGTRPDWPVDRRFPEKIRRRVRGFLGQAHRCKFLIGRELGRSSNSQIRPD